MNESSKKITLTNEELAILSKKDIVDGKNCLKNKGALTTTEKNIWTKLLKIIAQNKLNDDF